jgi:hypothetical protein
MHWVHFCLAAALAVAGDFGGARIALAEGLRLRPDIASLARNHADFPWAANPAYLALAEPAIYTGCECSASRINDPPATPSGRVSAPARF